ncbi:zinc-binding dehydrogenase [Leucobacter sp. M11]|uniref:zinc-binding dehydrogenase n=1 Tax=Leucobacter sp. M11 TaxID=2993565 RepID=UPI002D7F4B7A|nr:zinc-binding dehydrogenase [Leucobacter sp. M11]MEB4614764.1 zinc-binding dehydrogenase [Leucobacter sp. M11]
MRAAIYENGSFRVGELPLPALREDQIRVRPIANGVCGSDLSAWAHTEDFMAANDEAGIRLSRFDTERPIVFGHEYTAEVTEVGAAVTDQAVGDTVFVLPWVIESSGEPRTSGYSSEYPGGMSTETIVNAGGHLPLPAGVDPVLAATLEPIATGTNGAQRTGIQAGEGAIVTGLGPVGLGAVVELAARGAFPIVASDPSARRREVALAYGATHAVDPAETDPIDTWREHAAAGSRLYVVEASAAPGLLPAMIQSAPDYAVFSIVGSGTHHEQLRTMTAVSKNISLLFAMGAPWGTQRYVALDRALEHLVEGRYDPALMVTAVTGLAGAQAAFEALRPASGEIAEIKVLVLPELEASTLVDPSTR